MLDKTQRVFIVWGPTAEWSDGSGPLYYSDSIKSAADFVRDERRLTIDHAAEIVDSANGDFSMLGDVFMSADESTRLGNAFLASEGYSRKAYEDASRIVGWPTNVVGYWLECRTLGDLISDTGGDFEDGLETLDDYLERMNER